MPGVSWTRATSETGSRSTVEIAARIEPCSRRRRVSARVSIPSMPGTPCSASDAWRVVSERHDEARRDASRTANPATWTLADSGSSPFSP